MIAPRADRRGLQAARPVLVVGMAPSRAGHDLDGPTFDRLASYAGLQHGAMKVAFDFVNLLPEWPGEAESEKWDAAPPVTSWAAVGQRAALLEADLLERPRKTVVVLGRYVATALGWWWDLPELSKSGFLDGVVWSGVTKVMLSPHPAGTNMWWNDPANRDAGKGLWRAAVEQARSLPHSPRKVPLSMRSRWLLDSIGYFQHNEWPEECVDWPFVDPQGRPQALLRGQSVAAAHVVLDHVVGPRPTASHQALHSCDRGVEGCVNARHLRWGTELENRMDQVERSRGSIGKIGLAEAEQITKEFTAMVEGMAAKYEVTPDAIWGIATGRSWNRKQWETPK